MAVNISARNYQLIINGLDCTPALKSVDGGFSHYDSTGLILINASLVLGRALDFNENLDDRSNPRWARGNIINLYIANSSGQLVPAPIIGYLYILKAEFDGISQLKIEAGCILNLLNFRTPAGDGACFDLGQSVGLNDIASKLLNKAGTGAKWAGNLNGAPLKVPLPKLSNESYIQLFGKLCWANCFIAYQDNLGMIRTRKVSTVPNVIKSLQVGVDDARYERLSGAESPVELVKVSGVLSTKKKVEPTVTLEEEYGPVSAVNPESNSLSVTLIRRTKTTEKIQRFNRTIEIETKVEEPLGIIDPKGKKGDTQLWDSSRKTEIKYYEPPGVNTSGTITQVAIGGSSPAQDNCQEPDEGRLSRHEIEIYRPFVVVLRDYIEAAGLTPSQIGGGLTFWLDERNSIDYSYEQKTDPETKKITIIPKIANTTTRPVGQILPNESYANLPLQHYPAKRQRQQWREKRKDEWEFKETNFECLALVNPAAVESSNPNIVISLGSKLVLVERSARTVVSNSGQATPPAPERFPPTHEIIEKQVKVEVRLPALFGNHQFRPREKEIVIDGGLLTSEAQARELGLIEGHILWGRHKGQSCSVAVSDEWFNAAPLVGCWWKDISGASHLFMVDGFSMAFVNNRLALAFDGIWCGSAPANIPQGEEYDNLIPPYSQVFDIELGSVSILESQAFPYSIELTASEIKSQSQSGFGILTGADIFDIEFGSVSGFGILTGADIRDIELGSVSGFESTSPVNVLLGGASGIFVLVAEGIQLGSVSGFDVDVDSFEARANIGSVSGFEVELAPAVDIELGSISQCAFDVNEFDTRVESGSSSGLDIEIAAAIDVELGSNSQFKFNVDEFEIEVDAGSISGIEIEVVPDIDVELGLISQMEIELNLFEFMLQLGAVSGLEIERMPLIDYSRPFETLRTFSSVPADVDNDFPDDNDFVSLNIPATSTVKLLEIFPKNLVATGAPSALVVAVYMMSGSEKSLLSLIGYSAGENRASVLSGKAFTLANRVFVEVNTQDSGIKFAVKLQADVSSTSVIFDSLPGQFICANPGYPSNVSSLVSIFTSSVLPLGLSCNVNSVNYSTHALNISGASFDLDEELRINFNNLSGTAIPHQGISGRFLPEDIDINANTIRVRNSFVDFRLLKNQQVRIRGTIGSTLPSLNGTAMAVGTTYFVISATGNIGDQIITIGTDAGGIANITNKGVGIFFVFPFPYVNCQWKAGNRISIDGGSLVTFTQEIVNTSVAITAGTASTITHQTAHGYSANQAVILGGATAPTGGFIGHTYYVVGNAALTSTAYNVSLVPGGVPLAFTGAGTGVTMNGIAVTVTAGTPSTITLNNHFLNQLQRITLGGTTLPGASFTYSDLFVVTNNFPSAPFQISQQKNGAAIAFGTTGTTVTLTASISGNHNYNLNKTKVNVRSIDESRLAFYDSSGNQITLTNQGGAFSVTSEETPLVTGEIKARPILVVI
ncbi:hypothetical protein CAL7716_084980 [Calothrix sp. PCC 7716]|nr:hypothetical protein CAL7716_084980 [Calothrix sp. PCC 7716]